MNLVKLYRPWQNILDKTLVFEGVAPLLLRLYLAPIMIQAGYNKLSAFENTVDWFGSAEYGLGLPLPFLMASLAIGAELVGGILLLLGLATRWVSVPLMVTMLVAIFTVHWPNGWATIADASSWLSDGTILLNETVMNAPEKLSAAKYLLSEHGNYDWLTSSGSIVILNNGIEFAVTYFIMLLSLFFSGGGKYTSLDYFLAKKYD
ncbi:DoxX family protein [Paraglaciecola sp. 25GB23A]|uniref:HvfX family Cu-binding RiPP maturation protein n=1 Tax=Paraglaciecola sp. 25GB23A TaxID=3156068 RepID=UPI0032AF55B0